MKSQCGYGLRLRSIKPRWSLDSEHSGSMPQDYSKRCVTVEPGRFHPSIRRNAGNDWGCGLAELLGAVNVCTQFTNLGLCGLCLKSSFPCFFGDRTMKEKCATTAVEIDEAPVAVAAVRAVPWTPPARSPFLRPTLLHVQPVTLGAYFTIRCEIRGIPRWSR